MGADGAALDTPALDSDDKLIISVLRDVAAREAEVPFREIKAAAQDAFPVRDPRHALQQFGCGVIAVMKRATPGGEQLVEITSVPGLAQELEQGGAVMLACHTDWECFQTSMRDLLAARCAVNIPVVCRDIILDPYQIYEARLYGADMLQLNVGLLEHDRLLALKDRIESLGMTAMLQVRSPAELHRAVGCGAEVVGIDAPCYDGLGEERFAAMVQMLPSRVIRIALSGVNSAHEQLAYARAGADAVMVGRTLMTSETPGRLTRLLVSAGQHPSCEQRTFSD